MNFEEDETLNMTTAIQKGLVKTRPSPVKDTMSFSISAVTNPNTGKNLRLLCIVYKFKYIDVLFIAICCVVNMF